jgi:23S rRNA pseudouridine1911/1915/1917 synthase
VPEQEFLITDEEGDGQRLDVFLAPRIPRHSRSRIQGLIREGKVRVDGQRHKASFRLQAGERIQIFYDLEEAEELVPEDIPLKVLFRDEEILILDKPSGLVIHSGAGQKHHTLVHALLFHFPEISGVGPKDRPGIVHRLDKETSGVMVVALRSDAFRQLQTQFKARKVEKTYLGLARGRITQPEGRIDWPIGRHPKHGERISIRTEKPREAVTHYTVRKLYSDATYLEIKPVTGRMHQIRVHMAAAGHPLLGDTRYGRRASKPKCPRLFLHAHRLAFSHPRSGERLSFESPLPPDLQAYLDALS